MENRIAVELRCPQPASAEGENNKEDDDGEEEAQVPIVTRLLRLHRAVGMREGVEVGAPLEHLDEAADYRRAHVIIREQPQPNRLHRLLHLCHLRVGRRTGRR